MTMSNAEWSTSKNHKMFTQFYTTKSRVRCVGGTEQIRSQREDSK